MHYVTPKEARELATGWDDLVVFRKREAAEAFINGPPLDLGDPGPVTIVQFPDGFFHVLTLRVRDAA